MPPDYIPEGKEAKYGHATQTRRHRHDFVPETGIAPEPAPPAPVNPNPPEGAPLLAHDYVPERVVESSGDAAAARERLKPEVPLREPVAPETLTQTPGGGSTEEKKRIGRPPKPREEPAPPSRASRAEPTPEEKKAGVEAIDIPEGYEQVGTDPDGEPILKKVKGRKGGQVEYEEAEVTLDEALGRVRPKKER